MATTFRFFPYLHEDKMATVAAKKLQAKLAEQIFKETHCKFHTIYLIRVIQYQYEGALYIACWRRNKG